MKTKISAVLAIAALAIGSIVYGATMTSLTALPDPPGVFTAANLAQVQADITTANTNFTTLGTVLGASTGAPTGTGAVVLSTSPTITTPAISAPTGIVVDCASTAACPNTARGLRMVQGIGTLVTGTPSTYAVTAISPAFTGTTTYNCYAQDVTTVANNIGVLTAGYVSGSAVTFTGPNTNTDVFRFYCIGY